MKFKIRVSAVVVILVITLLLLPVIFGHITRIRIETLAVELENSSLKLAILDYQQGWFSSSFKSRSQIYGLSTQDFEHRLIHGPINFFALKQQQLEFARAILLSKEMLGVSQVRTSLRLDGSMHLVIQASELGFYHHDARLSATELWLDLVWNQKHALQGRLSIGKLTYAWADGRELKLENMRLVSEQGLQQTILPVGDTAAKIATISFENYQESALKLKGFTFSFGLRENEHRQTLGISAHAHSFEVAEDRYNNLDVQAFLKPREQILPLPIPLAYEEGLSSQLLDRFQLTVNRIYFRRQPGEDFLANMTLSMPQSAQRDQVESVRGLDLEANIDVADSLAQGLFAYQARLTQQSDRFGKLQELSEEERAPLAEISADLQLSVLTGRGFLSYEGGKYRTRIRFKNGQLKMNDQIIKLATLEP